jgi:acyl carrier protein
MNISSEKDKIRDQLTALIAEQLAIPAGSIGDENTFEKLGADSLDRVELIMKVEEQFNIEINDEDAEKLHNVGQMVHYIISRKKLENV